jgi:glycosyltransferase involved in cell wall biosynthesis
MIKRVLHIIPTLLCGGAERQLVNIVCNTNAEEFSHLVCTFNNPDFFAPAIREAGQQVHDLEVFGKHPWIAATSKILSLIHSYKPDLVSTCLYDANIVGRLAQIWGAKIPLITSWHAPDYDLETMRAANWSPVKVEGLRQIDKWTARVTKPYFVAVSNYVKNSYVNRMSIAESRIKVIYNGVDPSSIHSTEADAQRLQQELNIPADAFVYVTVGRLDTAKNHHLLLKVLPKVLSVVPQAYLVIVGVGDLERKLKDMADSLKINHRVRFTGRRNDIGTCLEMADVFVFPTLFEGFGLALVEAMFKHLPCIASDLEILREIVTHNETALLFNPNAPDELVSAMIQVFSKTDLRRRLGEQALKEAEKRFHIRVTAAEWEKLYRRIINVSHQN